MGYRRILVRIGIKPGQVGLSVAELRRSWQEAEDAGFESVWTFDHLTTVRGQTMYEATALLAAMAQATRRVRIGCLVLANGTRQIETLAATLATIDALSDGRLEIGIGAASRFARLDFEALGMRYAAKPVRLARLTAAVERLIELTGPGSPLGARPVQSPLPLILGGASGGIRDLAISRRLSWNLSTDSVEQFTRLKVGQPDPQAQIFVNRTPSVRDAVEQFRAAGASRLVLVLEPPIEPGAVTRLGHTVGL